MAFSIDPGALDTHANRLATLSTAVGQADSYATTHMSLTIVDSSFLFARILGYSDAARDSLLTMQADLADALTLSGGELAATAQRSRDLDDSLEAELDAAYPYPVDKDASLSPSSDEMCLVPPSEPDAKLTTPVSEAPSDLVSHVLTTDWFSPTGITMELIELIFQWNPVEEISKVFSGDWSALYTVESALANLGEFHRSQGDNITYAMSMTAGSWDGEAADAANSFFTSMGTLARSAGDEVAQVGPEFGIVARGMESTGNLVAGLLSSILDYMAVAAIAYAVGVATAATGVGAVVGALGGSAAVVRAVFLAEEAWGALQDAISLVDGLGSVIGVFESFAVEEVAYTKPVPYDNPTV